MSNSGCPNYRKGARKAAMELRAQEGELLDTRPSHAPVEANTTRELAEKLLVKSLRVLEEDLSEGDPRARQEAARAAGMLCQMILKDAKDEPEKPVLTPEQRIQRLVGELSNPDPELRRALETVGLLPAAGVAAEESK